MLIELRIGLVKLVVAALIIGLVITFENEVRITWRAIVSGTQIKGLDHVKSNAAIVACHELSLDYYI